MKTLSRTKHVVIVILVISGLYLAAPRPSLAQEPGEAKSHNIAWADLGYGDRGLTVGLPYLWIYFNVPGNLAFAPGSYIMLIVSHTGAQAEKPATLTAELNDHVLDIVHLTVDNDNGGQIRLDVPPEYFKTGRNRLRVSLRTTWDPCNPSELAVEAVLHSEGFIHLEYEIVPREPDLALYPIPFFERGFEPNVVYFVLPDSVTSDDLAVAATISAGLGRYSAGEIQPRSVASSELTSEILSNYNLIVIGLPKANTFLSQLSLPLSLEQAGIADDHGILQEIASPWNPRRMVLIVTGKTYDGMFKAGAALNRQISFPSMKGQVAIIEALSDPSEEEAEPLIADKTFEDLGYQDTVIYGTRPANERFYFDMPSSWQMSSNPSLKLLFTHSEVLTGTMSTLSVHLNGVPIGSTLLDHSNSKDGVLEVELLSWLLQNGSNCLEVFVDMSTGADECLYWTSEQAWTVISRNSILHLPYELRTAELDLANLLRPFTDEPNLSDTYIALPETLNQVERGMLLELSARLGAATGGNYLAIQVGQASELSSELRQSRHIVIIGQPSTNALVREVNDCLPQPFLQGSDELSQVHNPAIITLDPQRSIGLVQLTASPWNPDKVLLAITGTNMEGMIAAFDLLVNRTGELRGNLAMIEDGNLVTVDTRPLQVNNGGETLNVVQPDASVLVALAERWW